MPSDWSSLLAVARAEVTRTLQSLPAALRDGARHLPVTFERRPARDLTGEGIESDTLGLFVGEPLAEVGATATPLPAQIILFLENIRDATENDPEWYREEVRTTYLHELGHFLGLDEIDLDERGLG
jgi:predicted Zn-dependent protease with MMP-like domain